MRRSPIILLCLLNTLIACGLLWLHFGRNTAPQQEKLTSIQAPKEDKLGDEALWSEALRASSATETIQRLESIEDRDPLWAKFEAELQLRLQDGTLHTKQASTEGLCIMLARTAPDLDGLQTLARISKDRDRSLSLRNLSFRLYIENERRLATNSHADDTSYALIDTIYGESNNLTGMALLAEHYLLQNQETENSRESLLQERIQSLISNPQTLEPNLFTALDILRQMRTEETPAGLKRLLNSGQSERVQIAAIKALNAHNLGSEELNWLNRLSPSTPDIEDQLRSLLNEALHLSALSDNGEDQQR